MKKNCPESFSGGSGIDRKNPSKFEKLTVPVPVTGKAGRCLETDERSQRMEKSLFETNLAILPNELLLKIFRFLPYCDLNIAILVCRKFRNIGTDPQLWNKFSIPAMEISQHDGLGRLHAVLKLPRFRKLQVLDLNRVYTNRAKRNRYLSNPEANMDKFLKILTAASKLPLSWLDLSYNNLSSLNSPQFLASLVLKIPHVELFATYSKGSSDFISNILENVSEGSALQNLNLGCCDLDTLPTNLVIKLNCISRIVLEGAFMNVTQASAFLIDMANDTKIKKFDIGCELIIDVDTLSDVFENLDVELVANALNNVEYLSYNKLWKCWNFEYDCCDLPPDLHLTTFLEVMGKDTKIKQLNMEENNFFYVAPQVVAKAFNNLERLELKANPNKPAAQISAILQMMAEKTRVKYLLFEFEDISWLNPELVARAVVQVEHVVMECSLSRAHVRAILGQNGESSRLRQLDLRHNDVSRVPKHVLDSVVKNLESWGRNVVLKRVGHKLILKC